ncbi:MAG: PorV/PorQ family protein, partial [Elusimicrobia bacterium]|nr:PorV/PorQ family protein [Elusimicrobiota bacterium]
MKKILAGMIFCSLAFHSFVHADFTSEDKGTSSLQFLKLGAGARAEGMGSAGGAVAEDANTLFWNPAGLSQPKRQSVSFMHGSYLDSVFYDFVSYLLPLRKNVGVGLGVQYVSYGGIAETSEEGAVLGEYYPENLTLNLGGSYRFRPFSAGATVKYVRARVRDSASTAVMDFGLLYDWRVGTVGLSAHNLFSYITF